VALKHERAARRGDPVRTQPQMAPRVAQKANPTVVPEQPVFRVLHDRHGRLRARPFRLDRDARKLSELLRAGLLMEVLPPSESDEALCDLCRCRDDVRDDLMRTRHRMSKFLLRPHCVFHGSKHHWSTRHLHWLERLCLDDAATRSRAGDRLSSPGASVPPLPAHEHPGQAPPEDRRGHGSGAGRIRVGNPVPRRAGVDHMTPIGNPATPVE